MAQVTARPNGLPLPEPEEMYQMAAPVKPPANVLIIRATRPNVVSPRKRASVSWPMKLYMEKGQYACQRPRKKLQYIAQLNRSPSELTQSAPTGTAIDIP